MGKYSGPTKKEYSLIPTSRQRNPPWAVSTPSSSGSPAFGPGFSGQSHLKESDDRMPQPVSANPEPVLPRVRGARAGGLLPGDAGLLLSMRNLAPGGRSRQLYEASARAASMGFRNMKGTGASPSSPPLTSMVPRPPTGARSVVHGRPAGLRKGRSAPAVVNQEGCENEVSLAFPVPSEPQPGAESPATIRSIAQGFSMTWPRMPSSPSTMRDQKINVNPRVYGTPVRSGRFQNTKYIDGVYFF
mmetsp:Transcript_13709/g.21463  ORF Transcript_13709/g.21463 Transcript_13709/m.21463 type:complete len:244 (+) Transcript_13709:105-836(+)